MSGIYLLALIAIWLLVAWPIYRIWRHWTPTKTRQKILRVVIGAMLLVLWFGGAFWEVVGKKMYWDAKLQILCKKDGGIRVYETVKLSEESFDEFEVVSIPLKKDSKPDDEFFYEWDVSYYRRNNPSMWRNHFLVIRQSDSKILGEAVSYGRQGGDFPGPWHNSYSGCPEEGDISYLKKKIFIKK